jgi:hypothetical protein
LQLARSIQGIPLRGDMKSATLLIAAGAFSLIRFVVEAGMFISAL